MRSTLSRAVPSSLVMFGLYCHIRGYMVGYQKVGCLFEARHLPGAGPARGYPLRSAGRDSTAPSIASPTSSETASLWLANGRPRYRSYSSAA